MKKIQCYNCKKWGHYAKDCWADKADDSKGSGYERPSGKGEVNMKKIRCFNCQKWGHYARDCWADKVDDGQYPEYNPPPPPLALDAEETADGDSLREHIKSGELDPDPEVVEKETRLTRAIDQIREACKQAPCAAAAAMMSGFIGAQSAREDEAWPNVNITGTQSQMIMACMMALVAR